MRLEHLNKYTYACTPRTCPNGALSSTADKETVDAVATAAISAVCGRGFGRGRGRGRGAAVKPEKVKPVKALPGLKIKAGPPLKISKESKLAPIISAGASSASGKKSTLAPKTSTASSSASGKEPNLAPDSTPLAALASTLKASLEAKSASKSSDK